MPKIRGTKNGEILSTSFDGKSKKNFPDIAKTNVLILLSIVGNSQCAGEFLQTTIEYSVNIYNKVTFLVADEIYWHNLKLYSSPDENEMEKLKHQALALGDEYLKKNMGFFLEFMAGKIPEDSLGYLKKKLELNNVRELIYEVNEIAKNNNVNFEILSWRDWITNGSHDYLSKEKEIKSLFESEYKLKSALERSINNFVKRNQRKNSLELIRMQSHDYLLEESPAVIWLAARLGYHFIAYAGEEIESFRATKDFFITDINYNKEDKPIKVLRERPDDYANWLVINFKRRSKLDKAGKSDKSSTATTDTRERGGEFFKSPRASINPNFANPSVHSHIPSFVQGITKGILSMSGDENLKIQLLIKVLNEYSTSLKNQIVQKPESTDFHDPSLS